MITLIGTAEVMKEPAEKVLFVEDMTSADAAKHGMCVSCLVLLLLTWGKQRTWSLI